MNEQFSQKIKAKDKLSLKWLYACFAFIGLMVLYGLLDIGETLYVWFIVGALFSFFMAAMSSRSIPEDIAVKMNEAQDESDNEEEIAIENKTKECPYCAEIIKIKAIKCKHCGSDISSIK